MAVSRYVTISDTGEETWYDDAWSAQAAASGSGLCIMEYTYQEVDREFIQHAGHEPEDCER